MMSQQLNHRLNKSQLGWLILEVQLMEIYVPRGRKMTFRSTDIVQIWLKASSNLTGSDYIGPKHPKKIIEARIDYSEHNKTRVLQLLR